MVIYHSLPNPITFNLNPYRKMLTSLYDLVELPFFQTTFIGFPSRLRTFLRIILIGLSHLAVSEIWGFKVRARSGPPPRKREIAYKAEIRRPIVHSRFWSRSLRFGRQSSCVRIRRSTLFVRKSILNFNRRKVLGRASDVANSCLLE